MKRSTVSLGIIAAFVAMLFVGCGKKTDEALLTEYNAKKAEAEKVIADATEGLKKLNEEHADWMAKISTASGSKAIDSAKATMLMDKLHAHEPMVPVVQAGIDSLKYYVTAKTETDDQIKTATAGLNAHLAAVSANWKALWEAHTKAGAEIMADLGVASSPSVAGDTIASTTTTKTTTTTTTSSEKHETAKKSGGTPKVTPTTPTTPTTTDPTKHETAKQTPGGTPKTTPAPGGVKK